MAKILTAIVIGFVCVGSASAQSLAEASKQAKEERAKGQGWTTPRFDVASTPPATVPADGVQATAAPAKSTSTTTTTTTTTRDESYWKTRQREGVARLASDQTSLEAAVTVERALNTQLHRTLDNADAIRDPRQRAALETQWQESVKEVSRLTALVKNDKRAVADFDEEARRANVPPGWLR